MTIYILDQEPKLCAQYLDDGALDKMIKDVAQVLLHVHWCAYQVDIDKFVKLGLYKHFTKDTWKPNKFYQWTSQCRANYLWMVGLGMACCEEYNNRFSKYCGCEECDQNEYSEPEHDKIKDHKYFPVIEFARDNVPDLPINQTDYNYKGGYIPDVYMVDGYKMPFRLVMPNKYTIIAMQNVETGKLRFLEGIELIIESYRNYYKAKLKPDAKWSRRERPEWINI